MSTEAIDTTKATAELYAALAQAQADVTSVGKDGTNTQRGYRYATTEAMIRGARQHLAAHDLSFFHTWTQAKPEVAPGDIGKQHVAALVTIHWVIGHASGGQVTGIAHMDAIGSPARPPDKAVAAAVTYGLGFVLRGVLLLDRADEDDLAVDQRREPEPDRLWVAYEDVRDRLARATKGTAEQAHTAIRVAAGVTYDREPTDPQVHAMIAAAERLLTADPDPDAKPNKPPQRPKPKAKSEKAVDSDAPDPLTEARYAADNAMRAYREECKAQGETERPWLDVAAEAIGKPWSTDKGAHGVEDYLALADAFEREIERLRGDK